MSHSAKIARVEVERRNKFPSSDENDMTPKKYFQLLVEGNTIEDRLIDHPVRKRTAFETRRAWHWHNRYMK